MENKMNHWAYRTKNECVAAQIRRHIEENCIPGWEMIAEHSDDSWDFKIMKFDSTILHQNVTYRVIFIETWHFYDGARDSVDSSFAHVSECKNEGVPETQENKTKEKKEKNSMPINFKEKMVKNSKAREIKEQLLREDNICTVSDTIESLDEDMAKRVLKLFVYAS